MRRLAPFVLIALLLGAAAARDGLDRWIAATDLPPVLAETSVEMRDRNGALLRAYMVEGGRWRLQPGAVDPRFEAMLIRFEDKRFWQHPGVDPRALIRAGLQAIWHGRTVSGGSTLTMQVARLLENSGTGRWAGKLRQMRLALALERRLTKRQILELYYTHAPYGGNLEGVRAATLAWFGKEPARLTAAEAALLIALPQSPEARRPDRFSARARTARDLVLRRLAGQVPGLPQDEAASAARAAVPKRMRAFPQLAAHEADAQQAARPDLARHALTLDARVQTALEQLARDVASRLDPKLSVAILAADHGSGEILASVGSPGYATAPGRLGFIDMTRAVRSPGSTLKPLIYGLSFDQGLAHPETLIHDGPVSFNGYAPQNFDGLFRGDVRVREALQLSLNTPVVQLTDALGPARVMAALNGAGAAPRLPGGRAGLAIALGGVGMSLRDLVQLYAVIGGGGQAPRLRASRDTPPAPSQRVLSPEAAWQVGDMLAGLAPPPGMRPGVLAYKTGTSYGHRDAWAVGFDGAHVVGVWIGRADGTPVPGAFGGDLAAPVLFDAFGRLKPEFERRPPPPPATLIVQSADLPPPLQRFQTRQARQDGNAPRLMFPPDGSVLDPGAASLVVKVRGGVPPFSVLVEGAPVLTGQYRREFAIPFPGQGYARLVVTDRSGLSDRVRIRVE